jgi:hypothetical protein
MAEEHTARRTLVKSAPELWAECSVADSLARHLGQFGEIKITRLEPETTVAWEGTRASGTVRLEPSGWGTQVTLTAVAEVDVVAEPEVTVEPEPVVVEPEPVVVEPEPVVVEPEPVVVVDREPVPVTEREPLRARKRRFRDSLRSFFNGPQPQQEPELKTESVVEVVEPEPAPEPMVQSEPAPEPMVQSEPAPEPVVQSVPEPEPVTEPDPEPGPVVVAEPEPPPDPETLLTAALDSLGQAHHRPFSRP